MIPSNQLREVIRLEDASGRLLTYATVPSGRLTSMPVGWSNRTFYPFGQFRPAPGPIRPDIKPTDVAEQEVFASYRLRADDDSNDPVTRFQVTDPNTPRNKP